MPSTGNLESLNSETLDLPLKKTYSKSSNSRSSSVSNFSSVSQHGKLRGPPVNIVAVCKDEEKTRKDNDNPVLIKKDIKSKIKNGKLTKNEIDTEEKPNKRSTKLKSVGNTKMTKEEDVRPKEEIVVETFNSLKDCITDQDRFNYLFNFYSKWVPSQDNAGCITLPQLSKWLKNAGIIDGRKLTNIEVAQFFNIQVGAGSSLPRTGVVRFIQMLSNKKGRKNESWKMKLVQDIIEDSDCAKD
ncbi:uncharacterized protein LOC111704700 isoform X2 [Eurytemora carolleeae]|uniref:uncharacterized protein LOC111704700 isoform X2 n=1 Tax=Eurytemora carolleeae TaxID=1294199 RepID=UPI000C773DEF|nr:uncharacterized protein LOC111704700 isoform X2 [Eurytemora carolleeae]|eukprot:XP_023332784.1 uncharacterized protein LOC111704700 isoform X2 [Eurytemora affinis]